MLRDLPLDPSVPERYRLQFAELEEGSAKWRKELGEVSEDAIVWQPYPQGHSIGALLLHIADVELGWLHEGVAGLEISAEERAMLLSEETQQYAGDWPVPPRRPLAAYYEILDGVRARTRGLFGSFGDPEREIPMGEGKTVTPRWCISHVAAHEAYHGGQAVLLKAMWEVCRITCFVQ